MVGQADLATIATVLNQEYRLATRQRAVLARVPSLDSVAFGVAER
jgi:hypothetical protein